MAGPRLTCPECRAALRLAQEVPAGKHVKCPKCGNSFLPSAQSLTETVSPAAPAARRSDDAGDGPRPKRPKFRPKKQSTNPALIIIPIAVAVLLVLIGGGIAAVLLLRG